MKRWTSHLLGALVVSLIAWPQLSVAQTALFSSNSGLSVTSDVHWDVQDPAFGARGDGTTDDRAAIQKALNNARDAGGGTVYFPQGTYVIKGNLYVYSHTTLTGLSAEIVKTDGGYGYTVLMVMANQNDIHIQGLKLRNDSEVNSIIIDAAEGASDIHITGNTFKGKKTQAVNINAPNVSDVCISDNLFEEVNYGVLTNAKAKYVKHVQIIHNTFVRIYGDAIEINHPDSKDNEGATDIIIRDNDISVPPGYGDEPTSGFGIGVAGASHVTISHNRIENTRYEAIHIEDNSTYISILDNSIKTVQSTPDNGLNSGIYIIDGDYITIQGNTVTDAKDYGIHLEIDPRNTTKNTTVTNNIVTGNGRGGIKIVAEGRANLVVSGNWITGNAGHGITVGGNQENLKMINNVSNHNDGYGVYFYTWAKGWTIKGNSFVENVSGDLGYSSSYSLHDIVTYAN